MQRPKIWYTINIVVKENGNRTSTKNSYSMKIFGQVPVPPVCWHDPVCGSRQLAVSSNIPQLWCHQMPQSVFIVSTWGLSSLLRGWGEWHNFSVFRLYLTYSPGLDSSLNWFWKELCAFSNAVDLTCNMLPSDYTCLARCETRLGAWAKVTDWMPWGVCMCVCMCGGPASFHQDASQSSCPKWT